MKMTHGVLAFAVMKLPNERLDIAEAFTMLPASGFPCECPPIFVVAWIQVSALDHGRVHPMRVALQDPDGHQLCEVHNEWSMPQTDSVWNFQPVFPFFTATEPLLLPAPGGYRFEVFDGDALLGELAFELIPGTADSGG